MATAAKKVVETARVVIKVHPSDVAIGDRLGAFHPDKGAALGKLMARDGQIEPIQIVRNGPKAATPWKLVVGRHRHYGAECEGLMLDALETEGDAVTLRRIEADENVQRGSRSPLERASFVRAIADAAEARLAAQHGDLTAQQIGIRKRWAEAKAKAPNVVRSDDLDEAEADYTADILSGLYGWQESVAEAMGMTARSVRRDIGLHRALIAPFPDLWRGLATHPIVGENAAALREIASLKDVAVRRAVIEDMLAAPDMSLADAMAGQGEGRVSGAAKSGATKFMDNAASNIERLSLADQRSWAPTFVAALKPKALQAFADELNRRIAELGL
ncbi:hypothetical protein ACFOKF_15520 [Sphingobium rhizovicinum]|uniref:ParB/Sulfiredoxin domain-containing protein n=1 Tax=Sphingobium rhizovicinum TaxID=432308 RepID=A0ABV7NJJ2_9SPHN